MSRPRRPTLMKPATAMTMVRTAMRTGTIAPMRAILPTTGMITTITSPAIIPIMITDPVKPTIIAATLMDIGNAEPDSALLPLMLWLSPAFPVGAFAYSHGLEWAVEAGDISDARTLGGWLVELLTFGAPRADAILFAAAFRVAEAGEASALVETNDLAVALASSAERRLETTAQGSAFVAAARAAWDCEPLRALAELDRIAYPVAVAAAAAGHGLPLG